ncbi:MAG: hypothetical protein M3P85_01385 [Actinomycetota bacterium]|nr:hypothetical protein [Actinomycetota bacterium]
MQALPPGGEADRIAAEVLAERLGVALEHYEAGEWLRDLRTLFSPRTATSASDTLPPAR